ncbi:hypothetical protein ACLTEW_24405 [Gordonia lacunae]|uniref:hypothetical protein n=1 Tax=Gordonia TaxID=2053 RepID=UPI00200AED8D|nr:hypothetical protein [Gordonia terrae]UPW12010.1 hypothetical protein M1C59_25500 [Gordonia terrae]
MSTHPSPRPARGRVRTVTKVDHRRRRVLALLVFGAFFLVSLIILLLTVVL